MRGFELVEKLPRGPSLSFFRTLKTLPDAFLGVGMRSNIEQSLIGFGVLHDGGCFPLHCEYYGALAFFKLFYEIAGTTPESGQRLDILGYVKHRPAPIKAPF
jgi:hypothetical protein